MVVSLVAGRLARAQYLGLSVRFAVSWVLELVLELFVKGYPPSIIVASLQAMTEKKNATFVDYDCNTGVWVFQVRWHPSDRNDELQ